MRALVPLLAAALAATAAVAQPASAPAPSDDRDPIVYVLEDHDSRVTLLGSVHVLGADAYPLPEEIEAAYASADAVAFEIDMSDLAAIQQAVMSRAGYVGERSLRDALGEDFALLDSLVVPLGVPVAFLDGVEPWAVQLTILPLAIQRAGYDAQYGVDAHFLARAQADGKERLALETADAQMAVFDEAPERVQVEMLVETLREWDALPGELARMVAAWERGDEAAIETLFQDMPEPLRTPLLRDRNAAWVPQIEAMLARDTDVLVVVGVGHLVGGDSVVAMLRDRGHTVSRR